ncbi:hypothetical protein pb186bvf_015401 [Paramecium bursaria]
MKYDIVDDNQTDTRYPFDPKANALEIEKRNKFKKNPGVRVAMVRSTGGMYIFGPAKSYSMLYPQELLSYINQEDFESFISEVNESIKKYWPCFFTFIIAFGFALLTCFISLYLPKVCLDDTERFVGYVLDRWNETWQIKGIKVEYRRYLFSSYLEFYKL